MQEIKKGKVSADIVERKSIQLVDFVKKIIEQNEKKNRFPDCNDVEVLTESVTNSVNSEERMNSASTTTSTQTGIGNNGEGSNNNAATQEPSIYRKEKSITASGT